MVNTLYILFLQSVFRPAIRSRHDIFIFYALSSLLRAWSMCPCSRSVVFHFHHLLVNSFPQHVYDRHLTSRLPAFLIPKLDTAASTGLSSGFVFGTRLKPMASGAIVMPRRLVPSPTFPALTPEELAAAQAQWDRNKGLAKLLLTQKSSRTGWPRNWQSAVEYE
jgi:hypothetical protein